MSEPLRSLVLSFATVALVVGLAVLGHAATSVAATAKLENIEPRAHRAPEGSDLESIGRSIIQGASEAGWFVVNRGPGEVTLSIEVRGKHEATVRVAYDEARFSIRYVDSENLDYDPDGFTRRVGNRKTRFEGPRIHRNYNRWVTRLADRIGFRIANPLELQRERARTDPPLIADELEKLDALRRRGVLTDEEFEQQKARLLAH